MSRLIFLTLGTKGDLYPFLGMAVEMKRRGYQTVLLSSENHRADCEAAGCEFVAIQSAAEYLEMVNHPDMWKPAKGLRVYLKFAIGRSTERTYAEIEKLAARASCALVYNNIVFAGLVAHEKLGLPAIAIYLHPFSHVSAIDTAKDTPLHTAIMDAIGPRGRNWVLRAFQALCDSDVAQVRVLRARLGLPPAARLSGEWRNSAPLLVNLWPEWFCPMKPDWPQNARFTGFVEYDGPVAQEPWDAGFGEFLAQKPILFTLGSGVLKDFDAQAGLFAQACRDLGRPGLLVGPAARAATDDGFRITGPLPFGPLFQHLSAVVSHGGIGTVARAMAAGKPQLITPGAHDQFDNGYHVERLGLGVSLPASRLTRRKLVEALARLQSDEIARRCQKAAAEMKANPGTILTCDLLQAELARQSPLARTSGA